MDPVIESRQIEDCTVCVDGLDACLDLRPFGHIYINSVSRVLRPVTLNTSEALLEAVEHETVPALEVLDTVERIASTLYPESAPWRWEMYTPFVTLLRYYRAN